jgi:peptidoglycan/LPS O-acetylase OafA/YrhL
VQTAFILGGGASYAFYAIHRPFTPILNYVTDAVPDIPYRLWVIAFLILVAALAIAADRLFDGPLRQRLTAWRGQRRRLRSAS